MKLPLCFLSTLGAGLAAWWLVAGEAGPEPPAHLADQVSYRRMADALHAVLDAANQTSAAQAAAHADTNAATDTPSHAAFLRRMAEQIATHGAEFSFALRALDPLDPRARPQTQVEQDALEAFARAGAPAEPRFTDEQLGGRAYFTAVYPVAATSAGCVTCHNAQHADRPRDPLAWGDLMGALVIRLPREF